MPEHEAATTPPEDLQSADALVEEMPEIMTLAGDFDMPSLEQWQREVVKTFNRRRPPEAQLDLEQCLARLRSRSVDGLDIEPLYLADNRELGHPGVAPFRRGRTVRTGDPDAWDVRQLHEDPDVQTSNKAVLADLERGVTSLWLRLGPGAIEYADLDRVLADVDLDLAAVAVSSADDPRAAAEALLALWAERETAEPRGNLGLDPLGHAAAGGGEPDFSGLADILERTRELPGVHPFCIDATLWHDAGAGDVDELALALADAVQLLRELADQGVAVEQAFTAIEFRVSANADQFTTIARLRALRQLWSRVGEVCGVPAGKRGARQHAVTSWRMMTRDDPWVNMLRATTACFAASVGGAEMITVLPFDHVIGLPDVFSRRIARNTQIVLAEESNIARVNDPAGGSWYVESLTDQLAEKAWAVFQKIESAGGLSSALADGTISRRLQELCTERRRRIADRSAPITGVSTFPMLDEPLLERRPRAGADGGTLRQAQGSDGAAQGSDGAAQGSDGSAQRSNGARGLERTRDSEVFEKLRDRARAHQQQTGEPPTVFLAAIGLRRDYGARETFTSATLAAAGIKTVLEESTSAEELAQAYARSSSPVAVLCSSAKMYAEHGAAVVEALRQAGAKQVLLAGSAKELGADKADLVDGTIFAGMDVVTLLDNLLDELGVER